MRIDLAKILSRIGSPAIRPTPSTIWAIPNVLARVSSSVQDVMRDNTATLVPYPVAKRRVAGLCKFQVETACAERRASHVPQMSQCIEEARPMNVAPTVRMTRLADTTL